MVLPSRALDASLWMIVQEVLDTVLAPAHLDDVLDEALDGAGRAGLPTDPKELTSFVDGSLFAALARHLELQDATEITAQIRASLALAVTKPDAPPSSHVRAVLRHRTPQRVVVVSKASLVLFLLQDVLGDAAEVLGAASSATLRDAAQLPGPSLVLIDRKHPRSNVAGESELVDALAPGSRVILWGGTPQQAAELRDVAGRGPASPIVEHLGFEVSLADLGDRVRTLFGL